MSLPSGNMPLPSGNMSLSRDAQASSGRAGQSLHRPELENGEWFLSR